eukprot:gene34816-29762_t
MAPLMAPTMTPLQRLRVEVSMRLALTQRQVTAQWPALLDAVTALLAGVTIVSVEPAVGDGAAALPPAAAPSAAPTAAPTAPPPVAAAASAASASVFALVFAASLLTVAGAVAAHFRIRRASKIILANTELCIETAMVAARGGDKDCFRARTGLPCSPYFSAYKLRWLVCNASRTSLMDLRSGQWDRGLCAEFGIPVAALPRIVANAEAVGTQSASVGQMCFSPGDVKNTYGSGCFLMMNTGDTPTPSTHGLLSTRAGGPTVYALEGAVVQAGMLLTWLRDSLGIIKEPSEAERV